MASRKKRIVVKVGTSTLTNELGNSNLRRMDELALAISDAQNMGNELILVSSGAIAVGANKLRLPGSPSSLDMKQAAAAVGQCELMFLYDKFFGYYNKTIAQILLNAEDMEEEIKKENLTNTFEALLSQDIIPIVNENDSVSLTEIETGVEKLFSDNDVLSAVVAILTNADLLIILSDIDGFFDKDPRLYKDAKLIEKITQIDDSVYALAGGAGSRRGTGGMRTKIHAAEMATSQGIDVIVTNGSRPSAIYDIISGKPTGTLFKAN